MKNKRSRILTGILLFFGYLTLWAAMIFVVIVLSTGNAEAKSEIRFDLGVSANFSLVDEVYDWKSNDQVGAVVVIYALRPITKMFTINAGYKHVSQWLTGQSIDGKKESSLDQMFFSVTANLTNSFAIDLGVTTAQQPDEAKKYDWTDDDRWGSTIDIYYHWDKHRCGYSNDSQYAKGWPYAEDAGASLDMLYCRTTLWTY